MKASSYSLVLAVSSLLLTKAQASDDTVKILSIKGDGAQGFVPSLVLNYLEKATAESTSNMFDLIVGDGMGAVVGSALGGNYSTYDLVDKFEDYSQKQGKSSKLKKMLKGKKGAQKDQDKYWNKVLEETSVEDLKTHLKVFDSGEDLGTYSPLYKGSSGDSGKNLLEMMEKGHHLATSVSEPSVKSSSDTSEAGLLLQTFEEAKKLFPQAKKFIFVNIETSDDDTAVNSAVKKMVDDDSSIEMHNHRVRLRDSGGDYSERSMNSMRYSVEDHFSENRAAVNDLIKTLTGDSASTDSIQDEMDTQNLTPVSRYHQAEYDDIDKG